MSVELYPLILEPVYMERPWGGELLRVHFGRDVPDGGGPIGESLELVSAGDLQSVVANGPYAGTALGELLDANAPGVGGTQVRARAGLPIQVKYVDAGGFLPLEVHPDKGVVPGVLGKREGWYIVAAHEGAEVRVGVRWRLPRQQFLSELENHNFVGVTQSYPAEPGDGYFIAPGRLHAPGPGVLLLAVEELGGATYMVTDWDTLAPPEQLGQALNCIMYQDRKVPRVRGEAGVTRMNHKLAIINQCPTFMVEELRLVTEMRDRTAPTSFHLLTAVDHDIVIAAANAAFALPRGRSCFIPAALGYYSVRPQSEAVRVVRVMLRPQQELGAGSGFLPPRVR